MNWMRVRRWSQVSKSITSRFQPETRGNTASVMTQDFGSESKHVKWCKKIPPLPHPAAFLLPGGIQSEPHCGGGVAKSLGAELPRASHHCGLGQRQHLTKEVLSYNDFPVGLQVQIIALRCVCVRTS